MCSKEFPSSLCFPTTHFPFSEVCLVMLVSYIFFRRFFCTQTSKYMHMFFSPLPITQMVAYYTHGFCTLFSFCVPIYLRNYSILVYENCPHFFCSCIDSHVWMYHTLLNKQSINGHLHCFQSFDSKNNAVMNNLLHISFPWFTSLYN